MALPLAAYGSFVGVFISLAIATVLIRKKGFDFKTASFAICVFFMAVWVLTETFYHFVEPEGLSQLIILIGYSSTALMSTALIVFMLSFWKEDRRLFSFVIFIGILISLIPFMFPQGHSLERVGDFYMSFAGPIFFWTGIPYSAFAYMGTSIFLLWTSRHITGDSKKRVQIISGAFLVQYPISSISYIYGQLTSNPLLTSMAQSITLPLTLGAILYSLIS